MHDVLDPFDWGLDELRQLASSGHDVSAFEAPMMSAVKARDGLALQALLDELSVLPRSDGWGYDEPSDIESIERIAGGFGHSPLIGELDDGYRDRLEGAWFGRCIGCVLGKPVEGLPRGEVRLYAQAAGDFPITSYLPLIDPLPDGVAALHWSAPFSAAGTFDVTPRDDDIDWTILALTMLEQGEALTTSGIAAAWLDCLPFTQTYTAERAAYRNLIRGVEPPATATADNPYREWIGALIRGDLFGYVSPGDPAAAARLALLDARLSHVGNGMYGEAWSAALVAAAFTSSTAREALEVAAEFVPPTSRLAEALALPVKLFDAGLSWDQGMDLIDDALAHYDWVHTINNAAHISAGLLWGEGDFTRTVSLTVMAGADTDSAGATAGSVFGALHGAAAIPEHLVKPLGGLVRSAIPGADRTRITDLAQRTHSVASALREARR